MKSKSFSAVAALGLALSIAAGQSLAQGNGHPAVAVSHGPRTLAIDLEAIWSNSKVGKDIQRQVDVYMAGEHKQFGAEGDALRKEYMAIQQQTLSPNVRDEKMNALRAKQADFQEKVRSYEMLVRGGEFKARQQLEQVLDPILDTIMRERGADTVVNKRVLVRSSGDADITPAVMQQLDRKLSALRVELVKPPASVTGG
ncbi:MAG TPA: OmpH family outer membrane protein [Rhizomicrobium sp.]|jgi:Skp family chaperone for outer membrane proteins|nr:OmpH family outer membrane protein [Rhizomicrobium sp.]